jgi:transcriptional regulator with XRE-family HTH domain
MSSTRLPNQLRAARKRLALSQEEVAFLMGGRGGAKVSSYEAFAGLPNLKHALAFELIYGTPIGELFAGIQEGVRREVEERARVLRHRLSFKGSDALSVKRRGAVAALIPREAVMTLR